MESKLNSLKIFQIVAILEGVSYIALFTNMLLVKPNLPELYKSLLFPIGMSHGALFVGYIILAIMYMKDFKWSFKDLLLVVLASVFPFGTFIADATILKRTKAALLSQ